MKFERQSTIVETWMESGYCRNFVVGETRILMKSERSSDGIMEARIVGGVQKEAAQGWKPEEPWEGRRFTNFDWGYFIPNTSPPTFEFGFRMKEVQRNSHGRSCFPRFSCSVVVRYFDVRHAGTRGFSKKISSFWNF